MTRFANSFRERSTSYPCRWNAVFGGEFLERVTERIQRLLRAAPGGVRAAALGHGGRLQGGAELADHVPHLVLPGPNNVRYAEPLQPPAIVGLVHHQGHGQLRDTCGKGVSDGAEAAVMHMCRRPLWQPERHEPKVTHLGR